MRQTNRDRHQITAHTITVLDAASSVVGLGLFYVVILRALTFNYISEQIGFLISY